MKKIFCFLFLTTFLLMGCVVLHYYSQFNPQFEGFKYQRLLVEFADQNPGDGPYGEETLRDLIRENFGKDVQCYLSSEEFYGGFKPSRQITAEVLKVIQARRIDSILFFFGSESIKRETIVGWNNGMQTYSNNDQNETKYRMELFDVRLGKSVWFSTDSLEGNRMLNSFRGLMKMYLRKSVGDLKDHGLLGIDNRPDFLPTPQSVKTGAEI